MKKRVLYAHNIFKSYDPKKKNFVLKGISFEAFRGETIAIMGRSGEGKSTLLHIFGTLEPPSSGTIEICGNQTHTQPLHEIRSRHIGFIFQADYLLEEETVLDNILMPKKILGQSTGDCYKLAYQLLQQIELVDKMHEQSKHLSGGEKQRVAMARALCNHPDLILADEPTGNLDTYTSESMQKLLIDSAKKMNQTLIVVTHDQAFASKCDRILLLKEGLLYTDAN